MFSYTDICNTEKNWASNTMTQVINCVFVRHINRICVVGLRLVQNFGGFLATSLARKSFMFSKSGPSVLCRCYYESTT